MTAFAQWFEHGVLGTMEWTDWLDILLLAWLIYRLLLLVRGTRAFQALVALGVVVALYLASEGLDLAALNWALDNSLTYLVLALMIVFQEDIRRALARAGAFFGRTSPLRPGDAKVMEEVIKAVFALAHRKIGALVVVERTAGLEPYVEGAHPIDAYVTTELLQSIFHPSSPLHDGAVVLARNRVVAAGAFLPISLSKDIARTWGTRHRAAIGVTEETDAVCLVVSEERGTVAIVRGGEIVPVADANDLRQRLAESLEFEDPREGQESAEVIDEVSGA